MARRPVSPNTKAVQGPGSIPVAAPPEEPSEGPVTPVAAPEAVADPEPPAQPETAPEAVVAPPADVVDPAPLLVETKIQPHPQMRSQDVREGVPNGLILGPDDPIRLEGEDTGTEVIVSRDVYRKVYPRNTKRPTYILLYPRGTRVVKSTLVRASI